MVAALICTASCKKIVENHLIKDQWELYNAYAFDDRSNNFMKIVLPGYDNPEGCCRYIIDFQDNNQAFGFYYRNDTLDYMIRGDWFLEDKDHLYIDLDRYVKGSFEIMRDGKRNYTLVSDSNIGSLGSVTVTGSLEMNIYRQRPNE